MDRSLLDKNGRLTYLIRLKKSYPFGVCSRYPVRCDCGLSYCTKNFLIFNQNVLTSPHIQLWNNPKLKMSNNTNKYCCRQNTSFFFLFVKSTTQNVTLNKKFTKNLKWFIKTIMLPPFSFCLCYLKHYII